MCEIKTLFFAAVVKRKLRKDFDLYIPGYVNCLIRRDIPELVPPLMECNYNFSSQRTEFNERINDPSLITSKEKRKKQN